MKKFARILCVALLAVILGTSTVLLTACPGPGDKPGKVDDEKAVVFSTGELDNVFNSFFSTSAYDNEIIGQTQIGMMSSDSSGQPYCGEDEPTVALNYSQVITLEGKDYKDEAPKLGDRKPANIPASDYYTTYQFLIKNNIKFSDGQPLTINDVIFNLYTYLDPVYTGSSTIYSTAIQGLLAYRTQSENANEAYNESFNKTVSGNANLRLAKIREMYAKDDDKRAVNRQGYEELADRKEILEDVESIRFMFWDEINSDYRSAISELDSYIEENEKIKNEKDAERKAKLEAVALGFTEVWEVFLYNEGYITADYKSDGTIDTYKTDSDASGHYDKNGKELKKNDKMIDYGNAWKWWHDRDSLIKIAFNLKMGIGDNGNILANDNTKEDADGNKAPASEADAPKCDIVTDTYGKAIRSSLKSSDSDENYWNLLWTSTNLTSNLAEIVTYWGTGNNALDQFTAEEKSKWFEEHNDESVDTIKGITVKQLPAGSTFEGRMGTTTLKEDMYVLQIVIDRVDPQAIWNFSFTVTPMHYYSNATNDTTGKYTSAVDYHSFNYEGCPGYDPKKPISVGRPFADKDYFDKVLKSGKILSVPVGAGMYKVSKRDFTKEDYTPEERPTFSEFLSNNIVYYIRNPYFYTTSGQGYASNDEAIANKSPITNCKIKYVRYQVVNTSKLLNALLTGAIDYGDPSATTENMNQLNASSTVKSGTIPNNGYGYIGINAKYVPDLKIRQAIMHAIDTRLIKAYYADFASLIYRPISSVSWASPQNPDNPAGIYSTFKQEPYYSYDPKGTQIDILVQKAGYDTKNGTQVGVRTLPDGTQHKLEYTFTIAGATDDHPAYTAMQNAANILNDHGFKITVKTDTNALSKLAAGTLTVWAAAWGSGVDPDMYQVYHKDSQATSVRNWGYPEILNDSTDLYKEERGIINSLADLIDQGRSTLDNASRAATYAKAYDLIMDLAVELPTYQRVNVYAYNSNVFDDNTFNSDRSPYSGPLSRFWEVKCK